MSGPAIVRKGAVTLAVASQLVLLWLSLGCTDPQSPPPVSLDGPKKMAVLRFCLVGDTTPRLRVAAERCESGEFGDQLQQILSYVYISNETGNSVAVATFNARPPALLDTSPGTPGVTHIPVGAGPTEMASSPDGNFVFAFNQVSQDISVVADDLRREVARIFVGQPVTAMMTVPGENELWLLGAATGELLSVTWSFTCDGGTDYREDCQPVIESSVRSIMTFEPGSVPRFLEPGTIPGTAFVAFANRARLAEITVVPPEEGTATCLDGTSEPPCISREFGLTFHCRDGVDNDGDGLIDTADPQCLSSDGFESPGGLARVGVSACNDGLDNDADGQIDAADVGCTNALDDRETGAVSSPACNDGEDNDGDGLVDADDPECQLDDGTTLPRHRSEARRPACGDGVDNDGDGLADDDDPDCPDPAWDIESAPPECSDGEDNDGDGVIDADDPNCVTPFGSESLGDCADGLDNDGDGAVDLEDPGCDSPRSDNELSGAQVCSDGVDNDNDGLTDYPDDPDCYGAGGNIEDSTIDYQFGPVAIDPGGLYAYVVDRTRSQVLLIDLEAGETIDVTADRRYDTRIGVPVGRLPTAIVARRREVEVERSEDGSRFITRTLVYANVATSRGAVFFVEALEIWRAFDGDELTMEVQNRLHRLTDSTGAEAAHGTITCDITDELIDLVETDPDEDSRVTCSSPDVPQLTRVGPPLSEDDDATIELAARARQRIVLDDAGRPTIEDFFLKDDFYLTDEEWFVVYGGVLAERDDVVVDQDDRSLLRSQGGNLCSAGVQVGDLLTIDGLPTPIPGTDVDCDVYRDVDLTYRITSLRARRVGLAVIPESEEPLLNRPDGSDPLVAVLPDRSCFAAGISIEVRTQDEWVVVGDRTGTISDGTSVSDICVLETGDPRLVSRARTGEPFQNPFFRFQIESGITPPRDFTIRFRTASNFRALFLSSGPSSTHMMEVVTPRGDYLPIVDAGTNIVRVYDANSLRLLSVFF